MLVHISSDTRPLARPIDTIHASLSSRFVNSAPLFLLDNSNTPTHRLSSLIGKTMRLIVNTPNFESRLVLSFLYWSGIFLLKIRSFPVSKTSYKIMSFLLSSIKFCTFPDVVFKYKQSLLWSNKNTEHLSTSKIQELNSTILGSKFSIDSLPRDMF